MPDSVLNGIVFILLAVFLILTRQKKQYLLICLGILLPLQGGIYNLRVEEHIIKFMYFPIVALWLFRGKKKRLFFSQIAIVGLVLIFWSILTSSTAKDPVLSLFEVSRYLVVFFMYVYITNHCDDKKSLGYILLSLFIGLFIQDLISFYQNRTGTYLGLTAFGEGFGRLWFWRSTGTLRWPNVFGAYLTFLLPILVTTMFIPMRRKYLISLGGLLGFTILILIFTYSRSSWVAFAFSMIVFLLLYFWRGLITPKFMKRVFPFALAATAVIVYYSGPIIERWEYRGRNSAGIEHRYKTADDAKDLMNDNLIFGIGLRNFGLNANDSMVHNSYLRLGAETGIPGLVLYFLLLAMIFKEGLKVVKSKDLLLSRIAIAILCGYSSFFIVSITGPELRWFPILAQVWLFAGLLSAMRRIDMKIRFQERLNKKNRISGLTKTQNKDLKLQIDNNDLLIPPSKPNQNNIR